MESKAVPSLLIFMCQHTRLIYRRLIDPNNLNKRQQQQQPQKLFVAKNARIKLRTFGDFVPPILTNQIKFNLQYRTRVQVQYHIHVCTQVVGGIIIGVHWCTLSKHCLQQHCVGRAVVGVVYSY